MKDLRSAQQIAISEGMKRHWRKRPEQTLQIQVARYLAVALRYPVWWSSIDHAAKLGKVAAGQRQARGVKPGIPDLMILWPDGNRTKILGIELKSPTGSQSPVQKDVETAWAACHVPVVVCRSLQEVETALTIWRVPCQAKIQ